MRIMCTGGYGFIGSNFLRYLLKKGHKDLANVDKLTYAGNVDNLRDIDPKIVSHVIDIGDPQMLDILMGHKPDYIVNFAAETHVDRSIKEPESFIKTDVNGVFNMVMNICKAELNTHLIHVSTDEVYGPILHGEANEDSFLNPTSPYSASKAAGDLLLRSYMKTYGLPITIVRPSNNYGPNQYPEKLIPMVITRLLQGKKVLLHGVGKEIREWILVEDCCRAIYNVMMKGEVGQIYNIGSGVRLSNIAVIKNIIDIMHNGSRCEDLIQAVKNRPGNDKRYAINSNKTIAETGEYITASFKPGLAYTVDWYTQNEWWWKKIDVDLESNLYENKNYLR